MKKWLDIFKYNPVELLINSEDQAVSLSARKDLLDESISFQTLWQLPGAQKILKRQNKNGSWEYLGTNERIRSKENYNQLETYRNLGYLIEQYRFTNNHSSIPMAAEYLFSFQSNEGDFRGIYGNQYSPNYTAAITELLLKAGYEKDKRIDKVLHWLISIRQSDGGWAIPFRTRKYNLKAISDASETIQADFSKPFSHMVTGVVLRAFAAHPFYKHSDEAMAAGRLLMLSLFKKDNYPDRATQDYWFRFTFPFWFTDLISAMDTLSILRFSKQEPNIENALEWFISQQEKNGLWELKILKGQHKDITELWLSLAICRVFKRFLSQ